MKKLTLFILINFFLNNFNCYSQIKTLEVSKQKEILDTITYDSSKNFLGENVYMYKNQELYVMPQHPSLRKYGYSYFYTDYKKEVKYKCCDGIGSKYSDLVGQYFLVVDIIKIEKSVDDIVDTDKFYLKLRNKKTSEILYFKYNTKYESDFPFLVVGYYEKQNEINVGKEIILKNGKWLEIWYGKGEPIIDLKTGSILNIQQGSKWKCVNVMVEEKCFTFAMILENNLGHTIFLPLSSYNKPSFKIQWGIYNPIEVKNYIERFGVENWEIILNSEIKIGFTEEMVKLAWGLPKKINRTSGLDQWVYENQYLYFNNGKLEAYN
jgi:hypothetical protein